MFIPSMDLTRTQTGTFGSSMVNLSSMAHGYTHSCGPSRNVQWMQHCCGFVCPRTPVHRMPHLCAAATAQTLKSNSQLWACVLPDLRIALLYVSSSFLTTSFGCFSYSSGKRKHKNKQQSSNEIHIFMIQYFGSAWEI